MVGRDIVRIGCVEEVVDRVGEIKVGMVDIGGMRGMEEWMVVEWVGIGGMRMIIWGSDGRGVEEEVIMVRYV